MQRREFLQVAAAAAAAASVGPGVQTILYADGEGEERYRALNAVILYTTAHPAEVMGPSGCACVLDNVRDWCVSLPSGVPRARRDGFIRQALVNMVAFRPRLVSICPDHANLIAQRCEALTAELVAIHAADTNRTPQGHAAHLYFTGRAPSEADLLWTELRHLHLNSFGPDACRKKLEYECHAISWQDDRIPGSGIPIAHPIHTTQCAKHAGLDAFDHHLAVKSGLVRSEAHASELRALPTSGPTHYVSEAVARRRWDAADAIPVTA